MPQELNLYDFEVTGATRRETRLIDTTTEDIPELQVLPPKLHSGKTYETLVLKERGKGDIFINYGEGFVPSKDRYDWQSTESFPLGCVMESDRIAEDVEDNTAGVQSAWDRRRSNQMKNVWEKTGDQIYKGRREGDPKGFFGFADVANPNKIDALKSEWNEIDNFVAGDFPGGAANNLTKIYLLVVAPGPEGDHQGLATTWGGNKMLTLDEKHKTSKLDGNGNPYPIWRQFLWGHMGLQVDTEWDVVEIVNVPTHQLEKGGFGTGGAKFHIDNVISRALETYPTAINPNWIWMHHKAHSASRRSRQIINQPGQAGNAHQPTADGQFARNFSVYDPEDEALPILKSRIMPTYNGILS